MKTITLECPDRLHEQLAKLAAAVRRYLSLPSVELQEKQIMANVQWALNECR